MKKALYILFFTVIATNGLAENTKSGDWRKTGSNQEKIDNMVKVLPGASNLMLQMGERYRNLYWAAKQGKWQFAEYQLEEMDDLVNTLMITRPKRATTAAEFLDDGFKKFPAAITNKDWKQFKTAFEHLRQSCMTCHGKNDHAFITLPASPRKGNSPTLD